MQQVEAMLEAYPFLSFVRYSHTDYIGVIQNHDGEIVSVYAYNKLRTDQDKREFLELADTWWWESNRMIPINIFLKQPWSKFSYTLVTLSTKDVKEIQGHVVCLANLAARRTKRRVVQLVRKMS